MYKGCSKIPAGYPWKKRCQIAFCHCPYMIWVYFFLRINGIKKIKGINIYEGCIGMRKIESGDQ
jgi:hypothetical protein